MSESLLQVQDLQTYFYTEQGAVKAVDGVSFDLPKGKSLCIVGESGCGKSVLSLSVMRLIPTPPGKIVGGSIQFKQRNLLELGANEMRKVRGNEIGMIFQEPMTSLNPVFRVGNQIAESLFIHRDISKQEARNRTIELLNLVGIPAPERRIDNYPHQMSGGMRQRVMIAMALACDPDLLIADEPTTALDVTIQAQILDLINRLRDEMDMSLMMVTHDLGIVAEVADEVVVMYAGKIVERASVQEIFNNPKHPYTIGLLESLPSLQSSQHGRLKAIPGMVPSLARLPVGCAYEDRCPKAVSDCNRKQPELVEVSPDHWVSCWEAA